MCDTNALDSWPPITRVETQLQDRLLRINQSIFYSLNKRCNDDLGGGQLDARGLKEQKTNAEHCARAAAVDFTNSRTSSGG